MGNVSRGRRVRPSATQEGPLARSNPGQSIYAIYPRTHFSPLQCVGSRGGQEQRGQANRVYHHGTVRFCLDPVPPPLFPCFPGILTSALSLHSAVRDRRRADKAFKDADNEAMQIRRRVCSSGCACAGVDERFLRLLIPPVCSLSPPPRTHPRRSKACSGTTRPRWHSWSSRRTRQARPVARCQRRSRCARPRRWRSSSRPTPMPAGLAAIKRR